MTAKRIIVLCAALVLLCFALGSQSDDVYAQGAKGLVTQKGLASGNPNEGKGVPPTKTQMALGFGSVVVMIIVVKWL